MLLFASYTRNRLHRLVQPALLLYYSDCLELRFFANAQNDKRRITCHAADS